MTTRNPNDELMDLVGKIIDEHNESIISIVTSISGLTDIAGDINKKINDLDAVVGAQADEIAKLKAQTHDFEGRIEEMESYGPQ